MHVVNCRRMLLGVLGSKLFSLVRVVLVGIFLTSIIQFSKLSTQRDVDFITLSKHVGLLLLGPQRKFCLKANYTQKT